jgi:polysaccharide export outer membrane protein
MELRVAFRVKQISLALGALLILSFVTGCVWTRTSDSSKPATGASGVGQAPDLMQTSATLGQDDVFDVRVYQETDLTGSYRVSSEGTINFPLIGKVVVEGKTPAEIAQEIRQRLEADYLQTAYVSVFVKEFNSKKIFVFGEVQKPGTFRYEENMSIIQAITLAGGFTRTAAKNSVSVTRLVKGEETRLNVEVENIWKGKQENIRLRPGDIIFVPETLF